MQAPIGLVRSRHAILSRSAWKKSPFKLTGFANIKLKASIFMLLCEVQVGKISEHKNQVGSKLTLGSLRIFSDFEVFLPPMTPFSPHAGRRVWCVSIAGGVPWLIVMTTNSRSQTSKISMTVPDGGKRGIRTLDRRNAPILP